jgi:hypothetical protein
MIYGKPSRAPAPATRTPAPAVRAPAPAPKPVAPVAPPAPITPDRKRIAMQSLVGRR